MNAFKFCLLCSVVLKSVIVLCVTWCVVEFQNSNLMWWYLLACLAGWECKYKEEASPEKSGDD